MCTSLCVLATALAQELNNYNLFTGGGAENRSLHTPLPLYQIMTLKDDGGGGGGGG